MLFRSITTFAYALSIIAHSAASPTKRDDLINVGVDIENILNNATVNVLDQRGHLTDTRDVLDNVDLLTQKRGDDDDGLVSIDIDVNNILNNASISVISQ